MSLPLINRSLTTIRTELEFLKDSEVITEELYTKLLQSIPTKFQKDLGPWGVDKLEQLSVGSDAKVKTGTDSITEGLASTTINPPARPPPNLQQNKALGYCKALFDYKAQEGEDLSLARGEKLAVLEHLSEDWWKGYKQSEPGKVGVFPSNYVGVISQQEFELTSDSSNRVAPPVPSENKGEKANYSASELYVSPPPQYDHQQQQIQQQQQPMASQPSYGGYAQFPPPSTNYYPPQQYNPQQAPVQQQAAVEQPQQQQHQSHSHLKKFGGKLGNAAIFGAGATIGSDIVNSIF